MDAGLLYQNAKIKSKEGELFGKDKMQRLLDAVTAEEALRVLQEGGYPAGETYTDVLAAAEREATLFFKSAAVSGYGLERFLLLNDYHNAKVAAKKYYFGAKSEAYKPDGLSEAKKIEECLEKEDYSPLPEEMAAAFCEIKKRSVGESLTPSFTDVILDKAMFKAVMRGISSAHPVVRTYFTRLSDFTNLAVAYRAKKAAVPVAAFNDMLVTEGEVSLRDVRKIYEFGAEEGGDKLALSLCYRGALSAMKEGVAAFEAYVDDALLDPIKKARYDMFSPAAVIGFYLGKLREIKNVRLIFAKINNGLDKEVIKVRMRELYV